MRECLPAIVLLYFLLQLLISSGLHVILLVDVRILVQLPLLYLLQFLLSFGQVRLTVNVLLELLQHIIKAFNNRILLLLLGIDSQSIRIPDLLEVHLEIPVP